MAEPKTRPTDASVDEFIAGVADETRRNDAIAITKGGRVRKESL